MDKWIAYSLIAFLYLLIFPLLFKEDVLQCKRELANSHHTVQEIKEICE